MNRPSLSLSQQQRQIMTLAPQLRQSLEMLQMPILELRAAILKEMSENPTIEDVTDPSELSLSEAMPESSEKQAENDELNFDPDVDQLLRQDDYWRDYFMQGMENAPSQADAEEKRRYLFDSIRQPQTLQNHLIEQLSLVANLTPAEYELALTMIGNINDDGYFTGSLPDIIMIYGCMEDEALRILRIIQSFDPPGVGARTLRECLLQQMDGASPPHWQEKVRLLIDKHLDLLADHSYHALCKALKLTRDELDEVVAVVKSLNPRPGRAFDSQEVVYVEPEVFIVRKEGRYIAEMDDSRLPHIRISRHYRRMLEDERVDNEAKSYIRERIRAGAFLVRSIHQRQETIRKIAQEIANRQSGFFDHGVSSLKPMTMVEVAESVGVHETTVSRTVANKYMRTPRGLYELKYFFTPGFTTDSGGAVSNRFVQEQIKRLVDGENPAEPLSDQAIESLLEEQGLTVARRTIAKYRGILKIPPSHKRRRRT